MEQKLHQLTLKSCSCPSFSPDSLGLVFSTCNNTKFQIHNSKTRGDGPSRTAGLKQKKEKGGEKEERETGQGRGERDRKEEEWIERKGSKMKVRERSHRTEHRLRTTSFRVRQTCFHTWLFHLLARSPWAGFFISPSPRVPFKKVNHISPREDERRNSDHKCMHLFI